MWKDADFRGFVGREDQLEKIIRYNMERRKPMHYRTNDLLHSRRVCVLVEDVVSVIKENYNSDFNADKALVIALVHDDAETITGDIQRYYKDRMTTDQLREVDLNEQKAIEELSQKWPDKIHGFSYYSLLTHALKKDVLEAQIVSYCDKVDAFCECLHEVHAGNGRFRGPLLEYVSKIRNFPKTFPLLDKILPGDHPLFLYPNDLDVDAILSNRSFHTSESINRSSGISHYERWKELTIENFGTSCLLDVKEF